jgi:hypothetical protein
MEARRIWDVEAPTLSRQLTHKWRWGCQLYSRAGRPLPPRKIPGTHFCSIPSRPQVRSVAGRIRTIEQSNDFLGNRTHDLPACSIVPQPTTLSRATPTEVSLIFCCSATDFRSPMCGDTLHKICQKMFSCSILLTFLVLRNSRQFPNGDYYTVIRVISYKIPCNTKTSSKSTGSYVEGKWNPVSS